MQLKITILAITLCATSMVASSQTTIFVIPTETPTPKPSPSATPRPTVELTPMEKELLGRVEGLEKRIAELEGRPASEQSDAMVPRPTESTKPSDPVRDSLTPSQPISHKRDETGKEEPFAFADFTWTTGNPRTTESPIKTDYFTGEFRIDTNYTY